MLQLLNAELKMIELEPDSRAHELCSKRKAKLDKAIEEAKKRMKPSEEPTAED